MDASRRRCLRLASGAAAAAIGGCLSWGSTESNEATPPTDSGGEGFSFDPDAYEIESSFVTERLHAGSPIDELNDDPDAWLEWSGTVRTTGDESVRGDRSLVIETDYQQQEGIARTQFDEPLDLSDRAFSVAVKWDTRTEISDRLPISLTLWDGSGDGIRFAQIVEKRTLRGWHRYDLGLNAITGDPDLSSIETIDAMVWTGNDEARVYVDDFRTTETASGSYVLFHFDDIYEGAYRNAFPTLAEYGYGATAGVIIDELGADEHMNRAQLDVLADNGWEVCGHPHDSQTFAEMNPEDLESTLQRYEGWISEHGYDGSEYVIYPYGEINDENMSVVSRYHDLAFKVPTAGYGAGITSPLLCGRVNGEAVDLVRTMIDRAKRYSCVVPIMYHDVSVGDGRGISRRKFDETVQYVDDAENVEVITTGDWLSALKDGEFP
ncbi:polysaccharide deacetylase [Haloterrigena turkmenica DSM 5511]|uniref:Polysaccharide deacetylase n=1 Tax=Haloterrigena turkmenica (strain ATCC 51198 / DSM 5511 / JCM 9101 / NCIMB 13204 / VKM B-1734 / 4k) TaxID=543526 RepID=D2RTV1_HALTV|nr:polysaccharide deacetylase family protein [Haloterrigena turkmenica]ADB61052.1 polysaccharide deacetylase [Haloterrigena turkmenica DSM 5511]